MHKKRIIIQADHASGRQLLNCPRCSGRDHDGFKRNALQLFHRLVKSQSSAEQCTDLAGTSAEYRYIQIACTVDNILGASSNQREKLHHFLHALTEESCLRIIVHGADLAVALFREADRERYAERIRIFHSDCTLHTDNIGGETDVVVISRQERLDLFQRLHIFAAECDMAVIMVCQLIAGAGTANRIEINVLACRLALLEDRGIRNQRAVLEVYHALGNCQKRNFLGQDRKDLITEPVESEAADAAQNQVCSFQSFLQLLDLIVFDPVMKGSL